IAHNRCIDFLRRRSVRAGAEAAVAAESADSVPPAEPLGPELGLAVEHLVIALPPKERASVLLKDVFDYTLEEIAELVDSTVGGVKAALNRGRGQRLRARPVGPGGSQRALRLRRHRSSRAPVALCFVGAARVSRRRRET